jgi:hypothetical protein
MRPYSDSPPRRGSARSSAAISDRSLPQERLSLFHIKRDTTARIVGEPSVHRLDQAFDRVDLSVCCCCQAVNLESFDPTSWDRGSYRRASSICLWTSNSRFSSAQSAPRLSGGASKALANAAFAFWCSHPRGAESHPSCGLPSALPRSYRYPPVSSERSWRASMDAACWASRSSWV